jgi:hypothetical protein
MTHRLLAHLSILAVLAAPVCVMGQTPTSAKRWTAPRTPDGHPDLQGIWNNATLTPLERPRELGNKQFFTPEEAAAFERNKIRQADRDRRGGTSPEDAAGAYNEAWFDRGTQVGQGRRTSLVVDPADGRIPAMTPQGQKLFADARAQAAAHPADGPENRPLPDRCLVFSQSGPPMLPGNYNDNYQIVQTAGHIAILAEMGNIVRVIPLGDRPRAGADIRQWSGEPRGHWEGETLVVESTHFASNGQNRFGVAYDGMSDENLRVVERFTRTGPDTILYRATIDDPSVYTKPWTVEIPMTKSKGPLFEFACHEGNYAMTDILSGARAEEKAGGVR